MSQSNETYKTPRVKIPASPALATSAVCPFCGGPVYARNKIAQREINRAAGRGVAVKCHRCGG